MNAFTGEISAWLDAVRQAKKVLRVLETGLAEAAQR